MKGRDDFVSLLSRPAWPDPAPVAETRTSDARRGRAPEKAQPALPPACLGRLTSPGMPETPPTRVSEVDAPQIPRLPALGRLRPFRARMMSAPQ